MHGSRLRCRWIAVIYNPLCRIVIVRPLVSQVRSIVFGCFIVSQLVVFGCAEPPEQLYAQLQDEDPTVRTSAIVQAARFKDTGSLSLLVDRLADPESDVRFFAIVALKKITGETMGYNHYDPPAERAEAIAKWREWLAKRSKSAAQPKEHAAQ